MKLKRLFTAILSVALTLSLCAMPAMATEGGDDGGGDGNDEAGRRYACLGIRPKKAALRFISLSITLHREQRPKQGTGAEGEAAPAGATAAGRGNF